MEAENVDALYEVVALRIPLGEGRTAQRIWRGDDLKLARKLAYHYAEIEDFEEIHIYDVSEVESASSSIALA